VKNGGEKRKKLLQKNVSEALEGGQQNCLDKSKYMG